jgi:D-glycero-D-manno-heptose 1,7-bisphosphate phosphatase
MTGKSAAFLDRDGVINRKAPEGQYVTRWDEFHVLPGAVEAIALLNRAGLCVIVVTNQRCIAKGLLSEMDLKSLHQRVCDHFADAGATIDAIYYCPHDLEPPCRCRKPAPGMLLDAAVSYRIDLPASWMIGDSEMDVLAGKAAGCKTVRLLEPVPSGGPVEFVSAGDQADVLAFSLLDATRTILASVPEGKELDA